MEVFDLLKKYLNKQTSLEEEEEVLKILGGDKYAREVNNFMELDWQEFSKEDKKNTRELNSLLNKVHHQIRINENKQQKSISRQLVNWYVKVAAVLLLPLLLVASLYIVQGGLSGGNKTGITIESPNGRFLSFTLPDGTTGVLNNGSKLSYNLPFNSNRTLSLNGEAYFNVKHDDRHPFVVKASRVKVSVLGTKFGVKAYENENSTDVVLAEGKVKCELAGQTRQVVLKPDERLCIEDNKAAISVENVNDLLGWKDGYLIFRDDPMRQAIRKLERWYNVDVTVEDENFYTYVFRATFQDEPIEEVLSLLSKTSPIKYKIEKRKKDINGVFEKKHIILYSITK